MSKHENLAGGLFGFGGALFAAWVAAQGIFRQMHMDLITREEDRIERELPGILSALEWVNTVRTHLNNANGDLGKIGGAILNHSRETLDDTVRFLEHERILKTTSDRWRRAIALDLTRMRSAVIRETQSEGVTPDMAAEAQLQVFEENRERVRNSISWLDDIASRLEREIEKLEPRAASLREEIDEFFRK